MFLNLSDTNKFSKIAVELFHLKYAIGGSTSRQIKNLYEVCGQAQKSVNWKFKRGKEFLEHFLRREALRKQKQLDSRFELGDEQKLIEIDQLLTLVIIAQYLRYFDNLI